MASGGAACSADVPACAVQSGSAGGEWAGADAYAAAWVLADHAAAHAFARACAEVVEQQHVEDGEAAAGEEFDI